LFGGKELLTEFRLNEYDFEARRLVPLTGRFTQPDPFGFLTPETSPYAYCAADPVNYIDPTGCWTLENGDKATFSNTLCVLASDYKDNDALKTVYENAYFAGIPILLVDNPKDMINGFEETKIALAVNTITLNSHGNPGQFHIGKYKDDASTVNITSDLTQFKPYFRGKDVFIAACNTGVGIFGRTFVETFAEEASCTVVAAEQPVAANYKCDGTPSLSLRPNPSYVMSVCGGDAICITGLTINSVTGLNWNPKQSILNLVEREK